MKRRRIRFRYGTQFYYSGPQDNRTAIASAFEHANGKADFFRLKEIPGIENHIALLAWEAIKRAKLDIPRTEFEAYRKECNDAALRVFSLKVAATIEGLTPFTKLQ